VEKEKLQSILILVFSVIFALTVYIFRADVPTTWYLSAEALMAAAAAAALHSILSFFGVIGLWGSKKKK